MSVMTVQLTPRERRHKRVRSVVHGTATRPRLAVFRSLKHISAQIIDDATGTTLVAAHDRELKSNVTKRTDDRAGKIARAFDLGRLVAEKALLKKIETIVFDRGGYHYHGRVKALADGARAGKLNF